MRQDTPSRVASIAGAVSLSLALGAAGVVLWAMPDAANTQVRRPAPSQNGATRAEYTRDHAPPYAPPPLERPQPPPVIPSTPPVETDSPTKSPAAKHVPTATPSAPAPAPEKPAAAAAAEKEPSAYTPLYLELLNERPAPNGTTAKPRPTAPKPASPKAPEKPVRTEVARRPPAPKPAVAPPPSIRDPAREHAVAALIVGPIKTEDNCASCHKAEAEAWGRSRHATSFKTAHRKPEAKVILDNLGLRSMKRSAECRTCHYTPVVRDGGIRAQWGVSCESCHGPSREWLTIHNREEGRADGDVLQWGTGRTRPAQDRAARLAAAADHGMVHAGMLYDLARNCFSCHSVPDERLVNVGTHPAASPFELLSYSQGEVRHSFISSPGAPELAHNRAATPAHRRALYIVGALVDLEVTLQNLTRVTEIGGAYHVALLARAREARARLEAALGLAPMPEVRAALADMPATFTETTRVTPEHAAAVQRAARAFVAQQDGTALAAIDALLSAETKGAAHRAQPPVAHLDTVASAS